MSTPARILEAEARRVRAREILAEQAASRVRYHAERGEVARVDLDAARASLAAQRDRDERDSMRETLKPDFATSVRLAANRLKQKESQPKERLPLPRVSDVESTLAIPRPHFIGPRQPEAIAREQLTKIKATVKALKRKIEKAESEVLALQTFIGPRTPEGATIAEAVRCGFVAQWKEGKEALRDIHPAFAKLRAEIGSEELAAALAEFLEDSAKDTGQAMSPDQYAAKLNKKSKLREMTAEICRRLASVGIDTKREDGCFVAKYWVHSGVWEEIDQYRRICINPIVAACTRAPILAALEFFIQEHDFCRFWTFTTGQRCTVGEIGERLDIYSRKLSKLNHFLRKKWGIEIVIASTEFGTLEKGEADAEEGGRIEFDRVLNEETGLHTDAPLYHPHFHCVVRSTIGYRPLEKWREACAAVRAYWGVHCDFDGVIRNPREVVKYVSKPGDLLKLTPLQLKAFYEATANRRLVRPMGLLRKEIAARKDPPDGSTPKTLRRYKVGGKWKWREKIDHNKTLQDTISTERQAEMDAITDSEAFAAEAAVAARASAGVIDIGETYTLWDDGSSVLENGSIELLEGAPVRLKDKPAFCQVVGLLAPSAGPTRRKENCVMVIGNRRDTEAVKRHPLVKQVTDRTWTDWAAGEALAGAEAAFADASDIYVHTGTVTVPDELQTPAGWRLDDPIQLVFETA